MQISSPHLQGHLISNSINLIPMHYYNNHVPNLHRKINSKKRSHIIDGLTPLYPGRQAQPVNSIIC